MHIKYLFGYVVVCRGEINVTGHDVLKQPGASRRCNNKRSACTIIQTMLPVWFEPRFGEACNSERNEEMLLEITCFIQRRAEIHSLTDCGCELHSVLSL